MAKNFSSLRPAGAYNTFITLLKYIPLEGKASPDEYIYIHIHFDNLYWAFDSSSYPGLATGSLKGRFVTISSSLHP